MSAEGSEYRSQQVLPEMLLLFRLQNRCLDWILTAGVGLAVLWSRFAFLANGPWERDEVAFARAILKFDLAAYFPHPPGYPGWLAIGHLLTPLVGGESMVALQMASAAFSVIALWLLAALGRKVAPPSVAVAATLVVLVAPGPWLYAGRGFSSTAASVFALGAAVIAVNSLEGRRVTAFTLLISAAFLVRPNFLPILTLLWVGVVSGVRPWRRLAPGVAIGSMAGVAAVILMARAQGGWGVFFSPFFSHAERHFSRLHMNLGGFTELGLVKGLGGAVPATVVLLAAGVGLVVWFFRVGRKGAWLWAAVLLIAVFQLVWMQNRTYTRYAVGVQMALAPLVAGAAALSPPAIGCVGLAALAAWLGTGSLPLVEEQHLNQIAGWQAVQRAESIGISSGQTVVVDSELHQFASYLWHLDEQKGRLTPPRVLSPWDPGPWMGIDNSWLVAGVHRAFFPDSIFGMELQFGGTSANLQPLTQKRFLDAWVIDRPPLPLRGWWPAEHLPNGRRFMWGGAGAELLLPPLPLGTALGVAIRPAPGPEPLFLEVNGVEVARLEGDNKTENLWFEIGSDWAARVITLSFVRADAYPAGKGDSRPLAVQLFEVRAFHPTLAWQGAVAFPWQRRALRFVLKGAYETEDFEEMGMGLWLGPSASIEAQAGPGKLSLRLWAPRPTPARTIVKIAGRKAVGPIEFGSRPEDVDIIVEPGESEGGLVRLHVISDSHVPSIDGGSDYRELGVVIFGARFEPQRSVQ